MLDLQQLSKWLKKPDPFSPGECLFWDDPHISASMLAIHLDPTVDAASRRPEVIERSVAWLVETLNLQPGDAVLDLGCGPGLYTIRLAERGVRVTGVDYSRRSIEYAREQALEKGLSIEYRYQDYLTLEDEGRYDVALLIYGDFCVLAPKGRERLLSNVRRALRPEGQFVLDVSTPEHRKKHGLKNSWYVTESGFWKPGPHLVLEQGFDYPEQSIYLDQYIVIEENGTLTVYRNWFQDYEAQTITAELQAGGFKVQSLWGDLTGAPYSDSGEWIGVVASK